MSMLREKKPQRKYSTDAGQCEWWEVISSNQDSNASRQPFGLGSVINRPRALIPETLRWMLNEGMFGSR
jgi:hypothetical protein